MDPTPPPLPDSQIRIPPRPRTFRESFLRWLDGHWGVAIIGGLIATVLGAGVLAVAAAVAGSDSLEKWLLPKSIHDRRVQEQYEEDRKRIEYILEKLRNANRWGPLPVVIIQASKDQDEQDFSFGAEIPVGTTSFAAEVSDYRPGGFLPEEVPLVDSMIKQLRQVLDQATFLKRYTIWVEVIGGADGIPVRKGAIYGEDMEETDNLMEGVVRGRNLQSGQKFEFEFKRRWTELDNDKIAALRGAYLREKLKEIPLLQRISEEDFHLKIAPTSAVGGRFRRSGVTVRILNPRPREAALPLQVAG